MTEDLDTYKDIADDGEAKAYPVAKQIRDECDELGLLTPGAVIPLELLESIIGAKRTEQMKFWGPFLAFRDLAMVEHALHASTKGMNGTAMRFLEKAEVAAFRDRQMESLRARLFKVSRAMGMQDNSDLDANDRRHHEKTTEKYALSALFHQRLLSRKGLPGPEYADPNKIADPRTETGLAVAANG